MNFWNVLVGNVGAVSGWFGGGSEARQKAKMYAELETFLESKEAEISSLYHDIADTFNKADERFTNGPGEAEGKILTDFETKEAVWRGKYQKILLNMKNGLGTVRIKKATAGQLKAQWERKAELEEMKENVGL